MPCALRRLKARAEQERFLQEAEEAKQKADGGLLQACYVAGMPGDGTKTNFCSLDVGGAGGTTKGR